MVTAVSAVARSIEVFTRGILDIVFQDDCVLCRNPVSRLGRPGYPICPECEKLLVPIDGIRCARCGKPLVSEFGICLRCRSGEYSYSSVFPLFRYDGQAKRLVIAYKREGRASLSRFFTPRIAAVLEERFPGMPVVPIPARPERLKKEGWDQIGLLADALERNHGTTVLRVLQRSRGKSQKDLDYAARQTNLSGRIRLLARSPGRQHLDPDHWPSVVLLDDVMTTGATLSACARALILAGIGVVHAIVIASD